MLPLYISINMFEDMLHLEKVLLLLLQEFDHHVCTLERVFHNLR